VKAKNFALCIGIDRYRFLQPLRCARCDARTMVEFFRGEADFDRVWLLCDDAKDEYARPDRANIRRVLRELRQQSMGKGDNLWFFFSGHGMRHEGRDYLMPLEGDREDVESTALATSYVADSLRGCGADNVILLLDACRSQADKGGEGIGKETEEKARQTGVVTLFSCSPNEYSYELESLQQGAFTRAVLEGLGIQGQCATVARLNEYLQHRVPELLKQYRGEGYRQTPYVIAEPILKSHLILLPKYARPADIDRLKLEAHRAENKGDIKLARQLWFRVNVAAMGTDLEAIEAFERLATIYAGQGTFQTSTQVSTSGSARTSRSSGTPASRPPASRSPVSRTDRRISLPVPRRQLLQWLGFGGMGLGVVFVMRQIFGRSELDTEETRILEESALKSFPFETVTLNRQGEEVNREQHSAQCFTQELGGDVTLEMVEIPGGSFKRGAPEDEEGTEADERPQRDVTVPSFFMGKYAVTQAQWRTVASMPKVDRDLNRDPSHFKGDDLPVETVSWLDAKEFCTRLSIATRREYRLPSEAEWEYACRARTTTPFYFGETIMTKFVNFNGNYTYADAPEGEYRGKTTQVGSFLPNRFGLYDMHGNVWEWCEDDWHNNYNGAPADGSAWIKNNNRTETKKLLRGGSWSNLPWNCRSAYRVGYDPVIRFIRNGFRLCCSVARTLS